MSSTRDLVIERDPLLKKSAIIETRAKARAMSDTVSQLTSRLYVLSMNCRFWRIAHSGVCCDLARRYWPNGPPPDAPLLR
jgi:hypothetical protein